MPNVFNVGNVVKQLIWTRMISYNVVKLRVTPLACPIFVEAFHGLPHRDASRETRSSAIECHPHTLE